MAYVIPINVTGSERGPVVLVVVLTRDNLDRMKAADPFDVQLRVYGQALDLSKRLRDLDVVIAYEEDVRELERLAALRDLPAIIQWIERGRIHRPGDAQPPVSIKGPQ